MAEQGFLFELLEKLILIVISFLCIKFLKSLIMWKRLAAFVIQFRFPLLVILFIVTALMGFFASRVKLSYEFAKAIPIDNPKYIEYQNFRQKFGDDGNLLVIAIQTDQLFTAPVFNDFINLQLDLKKVHGVESVQSVSNSFNLNKNEATQKLVPVMIFPKDSITQQKLDSAHLLFSRLPFYKGFIYNPETNAYLIGISINKELLNSAGRTAVVKSIVALTDDYTRKTKIPTYLSGLPLIRTLVADRVAVEMKWFLIGSLLLSAFILIIFFRSFSTMLLSLGVVIISVIWPAPARLHPSHRSCPVQC